MQREVLHDAPGEFPRLDERRAGLPYRHGFRLGPGKGGEHAIWHYDLHSGRSTSYTLPEAAQPSEAVFAAASDMAGEGEGWLLTVAWRPATRDSALLVFDARALGSGPVATVMLPRRVPFGFHGSWVGSA